MALLDEILAWSESDLPLWQRDAVRRLFQQTLDTAALDDLYAMLKDAAGLPDPAQRKPEPLAKHHLPVTAASGASVKLVALRDVRNVNRLAPNQVLCFAEKGLTVVYGGNAAGKSGYARVLKHACRSRDASEDVRPNALEDPATHGIPQAKFDIELAGIRSEVSWKKGDAAPVELATVAVFDSHCARAYLDDHQEIAYLPFGLDVVENLAQLVLPRLAEMLSAEIAATSTTKDAFNHLLGNTKVGLLIATLTESTDIEGIDLLAQMSAEEATRLASLEKTLGESDPKKKANELRLAAARVEALKTKIEAALAWVKDEAIQKFKTMDSDAEAATATELSAADALRAGEVLLPGTGEVLWKTLFQAAREFSLAAYPGASFPHIHDGARCVLCQQVLTHDAGQRLVRFEQYVQASVAKIANERRLARSAAATKIGQATLSFDVDAALSEELSILDAQVVEDIVNFESAIDARRNWLLFAQQHHQWAGEPMLPTDPCTRLQAIANDLKLQERNYAKVADDKQRLQLQVELAELKARAALAPHKQAAIDLVGRMKTKALLSSCRHALRTKPISDKAKELASSAVTTPLRAALKSEFDALGVSAILPQLRETVEKGKMRHKLALAFETEAEIREILSEGEQRAIAIGAFLAELRTGGHEGGIVFDDPVSSLDHFRRQDVARRLVQEAQSRQVVIFTHDTSFLGEILDLIDQTGVGNLIHHLEWDEGYAGKLEPGLPWQHQSYKDRINKMQHAQGKLSKGWPPYPNDKQSAAMRSQYNRLRATIERVIQDVVFNGVVKRYRDWIRVDRLSEVVGFTDSEYREIARLHKKCCEVVDAHDPSSGKNAPVPTAVDLGIDIGALVAVTDAIQARRKAKATVSGP